MSDSITIRGIAELRAKATPALYAIAVKNLLTKAVVYGENQAKLNSPVDTGRLRASVTHEVAGGSPPPWAKFGTNVRYARPLDQPVSRRPHYRGGPHRGMPTKGWLSDRLPEVKKEAEAKFVPAAAREIEGKWSS